MFIVGMFTWWYSGGWLQCVLSVRDRLLSTYDYFSIDLLIKTLFAPFRQISAGKVRGPIGVQLRALFDQLISRVIGGVVRSAVIVIGSLTLCIVALLGAFRIVIWPLIPLLPIVGVVFAMTGWIPWQM